MTWNLSAVFLLVLDLGKAYIFGAYGDVKPKVSVAVLNILLSGIPFLIWDCTVTYKMWGFFFLHFFFFLPFTFTFSWQFFGPTRWTATHPNPESSSRSWHNGYSTSVEACPGHAECQSCDQFSCGLTTNIHHYTGELDSVLVLRRGREKNTEPLAALT